ncbi:class I SAM-dependent methyltransferase [Cellulomonas fimi]|uniref:Class I SAM-dependent methyltransferase n=1 Tax=Cellulomonas fimi TaxID=1708 RepID=A0A7Y0QHI5_CELFI|nr:class I SAM-dependent methyltransferase [Cellulomonas fimi]NMR21196.1 class I SAM-dependent methyltransferase [Cellulomonas fimi]
MSTPDPSEPSAARARSFGRGADAYRRSRPTYPADAARWLVPSTARRVLDLAAGTGKLTERLVELGFDVTAVEPDDGMRSELVAAVPGVHALAGSAEAIPLTGDAVDAVVVAQAWHWFDVGRTLPEIERVLRPGGRLGVVWNVRDHRVPWVEEFTRIIHRGDSLDPLHGEPVLDGRFGPLEHTTVPWVHRIPAADLRTLAASRSHTLTLPPADRDRLLDDVDELTRTHPDLAGRAEIEVPYRTECWRADLR